MKSFTKLFLSLLLLMSASCTDGEDVNASGKEESKLKLAFDLSGCGVATGVPSARAAGTAQTEALKAGVRFTVRAYKSDDGAYVDEGVYVIVADATGTGTGTTAKPLVESGKDNGLYLTRGEYDLRFLSYNSTSEHPAVSNEQTTVLNGKDLIATSLKNVLVRADKDGQTDFTISMKGYPFEHLCSCVKATFQIPDGQVVTPTGISEMNITLKNLRTDATYNWTTGVLTPNAERKDATSLSMFTKGSIVNVPSTPAAGSTILAEAVSGEVYVLPLDETAPLKFDVNMKIAYKSTQTGGGNKTNTLNIENLENAKALLPGKAYNFIFSLSFYGDYLPTDLMLTVQDYVPVNLKPDDVG